MPAEPLSLALQQAPPAAAARRTGCQLCRYAANRASLFAAPTAAEAVR